MQGGLGFAVLDARQSDAMGQGEYIAWTIRHSNAANYVQVGGAEPLPVYCVDGYTGVAVNDVEKQYYQVE